MMTTKELPNRTHDYNTNNTKKTNSDRIESGCDPHAASELNAYFISAATPQSHHLTSFTPDPSYNENSNIVNTENVNIGSDGQSIAAAATTIRGVRGRRMHCHTFAELHDKTRQPPYMSGRRRSDLYGSSNTDYLQEHLSASCPNAAMTSHPMSCPNGRRASQRYIKQSREDELQQGVMGRHGRMMFGNRRRTEVLDSAGVFRSNAAGGGEGLAKSAIGLTDLKTRNVDLDVRSKTGAPDDAAALTRIGDDESRQQADFGGLISQEDENGHRSTLAPIFQDCDPVEQCFTPREHPTLKISTSPSSQNRGHRRSMPLLPSEIGHRFQGAGAIISPPRMARRDTSDSLRIFPDPRRRPTHLRKPIWDRTSQEKRVGSSTSLKAHQRLQFFKTRMCPHFGRHGHCRKGGECNYAHNERDLRPSVNLTKTKLCQDYIVGVCPKKMEECPFAHGHSELRATAGFYKTQLCKYWLASKCPAGVTCRHAHGGDECRVESRRDPELRRRTEFAATLKSSRSGSWLSGAAGETNQRGRIYTADRIIGVAFSGEALPDPLELLQTSPTKRQGFESHLHSKGGGSGVEQLSRCFSDGARGEPGLIVCRNFAGGVESGAVSPMILSNRIIPSKESSADHSAPPDVAAVPDMYANLNFEGKSKCMGIILPNMTTADNVISSSGSKGSCSDVLCDTPSTSNLTTTTSTTTKTTAATSLSNQTEPTVMGVDDNEEEDDHLGSFPIDLDPKNEAGADFGFGPRKSNANHFGGGGSRNRKFSPPNSPTLSQLMSSAITASYRAILGHHSAGTDNQFLLPAPSLPTNNGFEGAHAIGDCLYTKNTKNHLSVGCCLPIQATPPPLRPVSSHNHYSRINNDQLHPPLSILYPSTSSPTPHTSQDNFIGEKREGIQKTHSLDQSNPQVHSPTTFNATSTSTNDTSLKTDQSQTYFLYPSSHPSYTTPGKIDMKNSCLQNIIPATITCPNCQHSHDPNGRSIEGPRRLSLLSQGALRAEVNSNELNSNNNNNNNNNRNPINSQDNSLPPPTLSLTAQFLSSNQLSSASPSSSTAASAAIISKQQQIHSQQSYLVCHPTYPTAHQSIKAPSLTTPPTSTATTPPPPTTATTNRCDTNTFMTSQIPAVNPADTVDGHQQTQQLTEMSQPSVASGDIVDTNRMKYAIGGSSGCETPRSRCESCRDTTSSNGGLIYATSDLNRVGSSSVVCPTSSSSSLITDQLTVMSQDLISEHRTGNGISELGYCPNALRRSSSTTGPSFLHPTNGNPVIFSSDVVTGVVSPTRESRRASVEFYDHNGTRYQQPVFVPLVEAAVGVPVVFASNGPSLYSPRSSRPHQQNET